jgi:hypothetical protein
MASVHYSTCSWCREKSRSVFFTILRSNQTRLRPTVAMLLQTAAERPVTEQCWHSAAGAATPAAGDAVGISDLRHPLPPVLTKLTRLLSLETPPAYQTLHLWNRLKPSGCTSLNFIHWKKSPTLRGLAALEINNKTATALPPLRSPLTADELPIDCPSFYSHAAVPASSSLPVLPWASFRL